MRSIALRLFSTLVAVALLMIPVAPVMAADLAWASGPAPWSGTTHAFGVAYGGGVWVVAGASGKLSTSTDPTSTWTARTPGFGSSAINAVAYGNGVWVAVGQSGKMATATDPTGTWTSRTSSFGSTSISGIAYGNGVWVAVGSSGTLATATDPTSTWTQRTSGFGTTNIKTLAYGNGVWVAVGSSGKLTTATDPTSTWTARTSGFGTSAINTVAYGDDGVWMTGAATGGSVSAIATASDPTSTWTLNTDVFGSFRAVTSVARGNGIWVLTSDHGEVLRSQSATGPWLSQDAGFSGTPIRSLAYSGSLWVAAGESAKTATGSDPGTDVLDVTNCDDGTSGGSLAKAVLDADNGDEIVFQVDCGPTTVEINALGTQAKSITIDGNGYDVTISGVPSGATYGARIFDVPVGGTLTLKNMTLAMGYAFSPVSSQRGGAIRNFGTVHVDNVLFDSNKTPAFSSLYVGGGAISNQGGTLTVENSRFVDNYTGSTGGAIESLGGTVTINNSEFTGNIADQKGGAIYASGGVTLTITNSTFDNNAAGYYGGAIFVGATSTADISNSTFTAGSSRRGGAIYLEGTSATLRNTTLSVNLASERGGALLKSGGTLSVSNSIVAENLAPAGWGPNCYGTITDGGYNLEDVTAPSCSFASHAVSGDPDLGALADNGGPTSTMALGGSSAATGAGSSTICAAAPISGLDQRGEARNEGTRTACDIGAYDAGT